MSEQPRSIRVTFKGGRAGRLFKVAGSERWYVAFYHEGKEYRETTGTADLDAAKRFLRAKLDELAAVRRGHEAFVAPSAKHVKVAELLDALEADFKLRGIKGLPAALSHIKGAREAFGDRKALDLTSPQVDRQIEAWQEAGVKPATINRRVQILGQAYRLAKTNNQIPGAVPTFRRLRENNARRGFVTPEQFEAIASRLPKPYDDCARLGWMIGWRKGELRTLTAANVDMRAGELRLADSKNGEGRVIPLRDEAGNLNPIGLLIERRMAARKVGTQVVPWLFHRTGKPVGDFRKAWASACIAAGFTRPKLHRDGQPVLDRQGRPVLLPAVLFHDLRRSFAKDAVESGNDPKTVMDIGGWKTVSTFHRYQIIDKRQMVKALTRLTEARKAPTATAAVIPLPVAAEGSR